VPEQQCALLVSKDKSAHSSNRERARAVFNALKNLKKVDPPAYFAFRGVVNVTRRVWSLGNVIYADVVVAKLRALSVAEDRLLSMGIELISAGEIGIAKLFLDAVHVAKRTKIMQRGVDYVVGNFRKARCVCARD